MLAAPSPSAVQPYAYGAWDVPFDDRGAHRIMGGAFAPDTGVLYLSLDSAGQVGEYDRPPVIVAFDVPDRRGQPRCARCAARARMTP